MFLWVTRPLKKGINATTLLLGNFMCLLMSLLTKLHRISVNLLQGEFVIEDKDNDCFLLDLSLEPVEPVVISSKTAAVPSEPADISTKTADVPKPATIPSISKPAILPAQPETVSLPHQRPPNSTVEPVTKDNTVLDSLRYK